MKREKFYFYNLDILRFVAFLLVFSAHSFYSPLSKISSNHTFQLLINQFTSTGGIGVHIFFVISGFIITYIILKEKEKNGKLNVLNFYIRRALRIWPLYYLILFLGIFILPFLSKIYSFEGNIFYYIFFLNNFDQDMGTHLRITWSIAVEEQFYLIWPLFFLLFKKSETVIIFSLFVIYMFSTFYIFNNSSSYSHTIGNLNYLSIGCLTAFYFFKYKSKVLKSFLMSKYFLGLNIFSVIVLHLLTPFSTTISSVSIIIEPILFAFIVLNTTKKSKNNSSFILFFSKLGRYTYGMYLYHVVVILLVKLLYYKIIIQYISVPYTSLFINIFSLLATIFISKLSYNYFELFFLKYKKNYS